jgi:hypothetical protein
VGRLELADPAGCCAREGPFFVAEQLRLDQLLGDRRAVDGDEGALGAPRDTVDVAGDDLLAGAAFAGDEQRCARLRKLGGAGDAAAHRRVFGNHRRVGFARDRFEDRRDQVAVRRQRQIFAGAGDDRRARSLDILIGARGNQRNPDALRPQPGKKRRDVLTDVADDQVDAWSPAQQIEA